MKKFTNLFVQDFKVTIRSGFHWVIIGLSVVFVLLTHFAIPGQINITPEEIILDQTKGGVFELLFIENGASKDIFYHDRQSFDEALKSKRGTAGIIISGSDKNYKFEIITRERLAEPTENLIIAALDTAAAIISDEDSLQDLLIDFKFLRQPSPPIPFNKSFIPVFITFEVIMMGFILIAVLVFQEKQEGSIRAYRISASGTLQYILSKAAVITLLGLLYGFFTTIFTMGFNADYLALMLIILAASLLINFLGLALSVFFKNISEFLIVSVTVLALIQLPLVSYFNPTFYPAYFNWIPSYPVIFGVREALFSTGKENYLVPLLGILGIEAVLVFGFCYWAVRARLMKSGGRI